MQMTDIEKIQRLAYAIGRAVGELSNGDDTAALEILMEVSQTVFYDAEKTIKPQ